MRKNKENYGIYDLTEDIIKRLYNVETVDRNSSMFHAEVKKVERLVKKLNPSKNSTKNRILIPANQYEDFFDYIYTIYENPDFYKISLHLAKKNPKINKEHFDTMDKLADTVLDWKGEKLHGMAKELYESFRKDLNSYTYHEEKLAVYSRIKEMVIEDLSIVGNFVSEDDKLEFLNRYEKAIVDLRASMMNELKLKVEEEKQMKAEMALFWFGFNADDLNTFFNGLENDAKKFLNAIENEVNKMFDDVEN